MNSAIDLFILLFCRVHCSNNTIGSLGINSAYISCVTGAAQALTGQQRIQ